MNKKQLKVLWIGIGIIAVMGLFPPWHMKSMMGVGSQKTFGFSFILLPPLKGDVHPTIDIPQLFVQWFIVSTITGGLIVTFKDKKPKDDQKE